MKDKRHIYVNRKNPFVWLMGLCLLASGVLQIALSIQNHSEGNGFWDFHQQLPAFAMLIFAGIIAFSSESHFYRTAIPVCVLAWFAAFSTDARPLYAIGIWLVVILLVLLYAKNSAYSGASIRKLRCIYCIPFLLSLYLYRHELASWDWIQMLPAIFAGIGCLLLVFVVRLHPVDGAYPRWNDRADGRLIRSRSPMDRVSPYLMVQRNESFILFEDSLEITEVDQFIRKKRKEGMTSFGFIHVLLASYCRCICRYPGLNRFLSGQKVFSRGEDIVFCLTVKKEMSTKAPDTVIKVHLSPRDTVSDVYRKVQDEVEKAKNTPLDSGMDKAAWVLTLIPGLILKFTVFLLKVLDYFGLLPKFLLEVSPFHGSIFLTSMGSLGIPPVFHHLYNFGNIPVFGAFGMKRRSNEMQEDGSVVQKKFVDVKFTVDERIVDGFYYAAFFKHFKRVFAKPEQLESPPESVLKDID